MINYKDPYFKLPLIEKLKICREQAKEILGEDHSLTESIEDAFIKIGIKNMNVKEKGS